MTSNLIYKVNLKDKIFDISNELISDCVFYKKNYDFVYSFEIQTKYKSYLYKTFYEECSKFLRKFTLSDENNFIIWCYLTNEEYRGGDGVWHNHSTTATINGVLYLKTNEGDKIEFPNFCVEPKDYDLLIFPGYLDHRPILSSTNTRISLNMELKCKEHEHKIFGF
jgi:hypothetical protein